MGSFCILIAYWNPINERIETFSFYILVFLKVINCRIIRLEKVWRQLILWNYYAGILILTLLSVVLFSERLSEPCFDLFTSIYSKIFSTTCMYWNCKSKIFNKKYAKHSTVQYLQCHGHAFWFNHFTFPCIFGRVFPYILHR